jgi:hypothetical protein
MEVVLTAFITMKLADEIKKLSQYAIEVGVNQKNIDDL